MSKVQLWMAFGGVFVLAIGLYAFVFNNKLVDYSVLAKDTILLYVESGDVSYKAEGEAAFQKATTSPVAISNKSYVNTGIGKAMVLLPDNSSVELDDYTELQINYEKNRTLLHQTLGTTYHRVRELLTGSSYEVTTPGTLAAVRGTKFAVKYDKKTRITKIAVTESRVLVAKQDETGTSTESIILEEGKIAKIDDKAQAGVQGIVIGETKSDIEMKAWVDRNKERDIMFDSLNSANTDSVRESMQNLISKNPDGNTETTSPEKTVETEKGEDTSNAVIKTTTQIEQRTTETPEQVTPPLVINKLDEETFFNKFTGLFSDYFYLDAANKPCSFAVSPEERVRVVTVFATGSGYPFTSRTLLSFAQEIDSYCKNKSAEAKQNLQGRFDVEFPFND